MLSRIGNSEKRFVRQLEKADVRHRTLLELGRVSLPVAEGKLAIVHSFGTTTNSDYTDKQQKKIFEEEAHHVAESDLAKAYDDVQVVPVASAIDLDLVFGDKEVAGMVLVGHGTIAAFRLANDKHYNWQNAERAVTDLKLGHFVQRTCGMFKVPQSVPLGTYVVSNRRNLVAPVGLVIDDKHPDESAFTHVYDSEQVSPEDVIAMRDRMYRPVDEP